MDISTRIANIRLHNQQLVTSNFTTPAQVVGWMGAMQAQDYNLARWAIGARLPETTAKQVEEAVSKGEVIRTHILRPTWHFVAVEDIRWMMQLTAPRIRPTLRQYDKYLSIDESTITKTKEVIVKALEQYGYLTRMELSRFVDEIGVHTKDNWMAHFMMHAEMDGLVCSAGMKGKDMTYRLLSEISPENNNFDRDESLDKLARRYFSSHSPASLPDFVWWSGLTMTDVKRSVEMIKRDFIIEQLGGQTYVFPSDGNSCELKSDYVHLLPCWDEYLVSYKDRSHVLVDEHYAKVISSKNGTFKPAISHNGNIIGSWKRIVKGKKITIETELFQKPSKSISDMLDIEIGRFLRFHNAD